MSFIAADPERYVGRKVGNGHCVALVREAANVPHASAWRRGQLVRGAVLARGTAIATFTPGGKYGNHTDGRSHCALLDRELDHGLAVYDQWVGQPGHRRVIRWKSGAHPAVDDGDAYHVIEVDTEDD